MRRSSRREFVVELTLLWQAALLRAREHHHASEPRKTAEPYKFLFFDDGQKQSVRLLSERFIPADERSPGAVGAKVDEYIDFVLSHADVRTQAAWKSGLQRYAHAIAGKGGADIDLYLEAQARHEFAPTNSDETFFVLLKTAITEGFYTSEVGIVQELGYKGMSFLLDFEGCTHPNHHAPDGWRPILQQSKES